MDKLTNLQIFRRVAETRSFTAAAKELGVSPAMVSKSVQQLEQTLGARLLARSTRAVNMTEAGERYLQSIAPLLDELVVADQQLRQHVQQPRGELRLSAPIDLGETLLAPVLRDFRRACPDVTLSVDLSNRHVDLHHEPVDLALRVGHVTQSSLVVRRLGNIPLMVCAAPEYLAGAPALAHPRDLSQHACLVNPSAGDPRRWLFQEQGKALSVTANVVMQVNNARVLVQAAEAGLGIIYLPAYLVRDALAAGRLVPLLSDYVLPALPLSLVYVDRRFLPVKVRVFIDHLSLALTQEGEFKRAAAQ
jgi:LysR family transcriptional regulator, regulator for bpeEF and oprC